MVDGVLEPLAPVAAQGDGRDEVPLVAGGLVEPGHGAGGAVERGVDGDDAQRAGAAGDQGAGGGVAAVAEAVDGGGDLGAGGGPYVRVAAEDAGDRLVGDAGLPGHVGHRRRPGDFRGPGHAGLPSRWDARDPAGSRSGVDAEKAYPPSCITRV